MTLAPGTRLGPYEVVERLGAGGMGEVFRARDTRLGRSVALKVLPADYAADAELRARLEREARAISQLNHPHICTLYDVGVEQGVPYLVLELLEGETLAQRIARGPLPTADVLRYGTQIAQALARAHRAGIVHRDLKPGNVMITSTGSKLLDFGLARQTRADGGDDSSTGHGTLIGTVPYMAPEQLARKKADERSDVYALGAILYEMATGHRAFDGRRTPAPGPAPSSSELTIGDEQRPALPPGARHVLQPAALDHLVGRCLSPDPAARWQSAHDVAQQLAFLSSQPNVSNAAPGWRPAWHAVAAVLACAAAAVAWAGRAGPAPTASGAYRFVVPRHGPDLYAGMFAGLSPDGRRLAIHGRRDGTSGPGQLFVHSLDTFGFRPVGGTHGARFGAWSPDGRHMLFARGNTLHRVTWEDDKVELVAQIPRDLWERTLDCSNCLGWTAQGDILVGLANGTVAHLGRGAQRFEDVPPGIGLAPGDTGLLHPTFLPDGRTFLAMSHTEASGPARSSALYAGRLGEGIVKRLGPIHSRVRYTQGHLFHVREGTLLASPFDPATLTLGASSEVVATDVFEWPDGGAAFDAAGGTVVYLPTPRADQIWLFEQDGDRVRAVGPTTPLAKGNLSLRPDGAEIAVFAGLPERTHPRDLWAFGVDRPTLVRLTDDPGMELGPLYGPDGRELFYVKGHISNDIYRRRLGTGQPDERVLSGPRDEFAEAVSPDGRHLVVMEVREDEGTGPDLFILPLAGGPARVLSASRAIEQEASFSPDGRWVTYASDVSGRFEVYAQPFPGPGTPVQVTTAGGHNARWSPDGRSVFFVHDDHEVHVVGFNGGRPGEPRRLFRIPENIKDLAGVRRDGRLVLAVYDQRAALQVPLHVIAGWTPEASRP